MNKFNFSASAGSSHRLVGAIKKIDTLLGIADYGMLDIIMPLGWHNGKFT